jgi:hypothetical protein
MTARHPMRRNSRAGDANSGSDRPKPPELERTDSGNTIEFAPPPRKLQDWWPPDSGCVLAVLCAIAALVIVLVLLDWLLDLAQP